MLNFLGFRRFDIDKIHKLSKYDQILDVRQFFSDCSNVFQTFGLFLVKFVIRFLAKLTGWLIKVYLDDFLFRLCSHDDISQEELDNRFGLNSLQSVLTVAAI